MIENPKVAVLMSGGALFRRWEPAEVHGVSLLYVPPGRSTLPRGRHEILHCDLADPRLALYSALADAVQRLDSVLRDLDPCWLEPTSYHSTFAGSVNDFNLGQLDGGGNAQIRRFLRELPGSLASSLPAALPPSRFESSRPWRVRFRFGGLQVSPDSFALVALLEPADDESRRTLDALHAVRGTLNDDLVTRGMSREPAPAPHVTLCYFATREHARHARERIAGSRLADLSAALQNLVIEHGSIGLYGWTSMVEFWPHRLFGDWASVEDYAAQSALVGAALADPDHSLDRLLSLMRENRQAALYLLGSRLDNGFCFGSDDLGALLSVLPQDGAKAGIPGYHPASTEVYVTFQGRMIMDWIEPGQELVVSSITGRDDILVLPPGRCHRVRDAAGATAASLVVKTNLGHRPGVVRCDGCDYFPDPKQCALHNDWQAEDGRNQPQPRIDDGTPAMLRHGAPDRSRSGVEQRGENKAK